MAFTLFVDPRALDDIQGAIDYYDSVQIGLGTRFETILNAYFQTLKSAPHFQKRYGPVRCLPLKTFPYMVHYSIDDAKKKNRRLGCISHRFRPKEMEGKNEVSIR